MDAQDLVTGIRWDLMKLIAEKPSTGAELAKAIKTSAANASQHLKLLELAGLVTKERVNGKSMHYRINQESVLVTVLSSKPHRDIIPLEGLAGLEFRLFLERKPRNKYLRKFICVYEEIIKNFVGFGTVKEGEDIQLLVLAEDVKALRKEYANIHLGDKKIVIWSHTPDEFTEGLQRNEHYFTEMKKALNVIYDPKGVLAAIKEEQ